MNRLTLKAQLTRHEGLRLKPYTDTVGKMTIGVGRNLSDVGISVEEAGHLLDNDIASVEADLWRHIPNWGTLNDVRQRALADMAFNLGIVRFLGFRRMLAAVAAGDWDTASAQMLDSQWARQVGDRADELALMLKEGR